MAVLGAIDLLRGNREKLEEKIRAMPYYFIFVSYLLTTIYVLLAGAGLLGHYSTNCVGFRFVGLTLLLLGLLAFIQFFITCCAISIDEGVEASFVPFCCCYLPAFVTTVCFMTFLLRVSHQGGGTVVVGRSYEEYNLTSYSPWLQRKVNDTHLWDNHYKPALIKHKVCSTFAADYSQGTHLSPVQSGCCKPPDSCNFNQTSPANWIKSKDHSHSNIDCYAWDNDANTRCFNCQSCKAGFLQDVKSHWHSTGVHLIWHTAFIGGVIFCLIISLAM